MENKIKIEWGEEIVMGIFEQDLIPSKELLTHINFIQLLGSLVREARDD